MSGNFSDSGEKKTCTVPSSAEEMSETFGLWYPVKAYFWIKCMCIDSRMFFSHLGELIFFFCGWQQWCVSVPCGVLIWQTGCQFLQTLLFWSALKLGRFFIFNSDFRKGGEDIVWPTHHRSRWYFLWITFSTNRWSGELTKNGKKKQEWSHWTKNMFLDATIS